jgi:fructose-1,6-bisphosphatase/inositol monophosphatase family enzyme
MMDFLAAILRQAGELLLAIQSERQAVEFKIRHSDLVTAADRAADALPIHAMAS